MWMVRAGEGGYLFEEFKKKNIVAIGWELGDLKNTTNSDDIKALLMKKHPEQKQGKINMNAGQISRFKSDFKIGDNVITYNPVSREYLIGEIVGEYEYNSNEEYKHIRKVKWLGSVQRDNLSVSTKNSLGSIATIFEVNKEAKTELLNLLDGIKPAMNVNEEQLKLENIKEDTEDKSRELIKDKISNLTWEQMQELVAGILRALGYKTRVSKRGADGGRDIVASKDGIGLEKPRIIAEVKHREGQMDTKEVSSFIGRIRPEHMAMYVSTGGFTKNATLEAQRSNIPITLVDIDYLVDLIIQNYENFDNETRQLLPLTKIYWPD